MYTHDGETRPLTWDDLVPGNVIRMITTRVPDGSGGHDIVSAYGEHTIMGIGPDEHGTSHVKLARPYCFVSSAETLCASPLVGVEVYMVEASKLVGHRSRYRLVLLSTGEASNLTT